MRIQRLNEDTKKNLLEDLLKRILVLEREKIIYENNAKIVEN